jgi:hypothetical protein
MMVYVTARGTSYHRIRDCRAITSAHKAAITSGTNPHPPVLMSLEEAIARKPEIKECKACADAPAIEEKPTQRSVDLDAVEVRYEIGFGPAATTAKGYLLVPSEQWKAILPEDRNEWVLDMIKKQAADQLQIFWRTAE